MLTGESTRKSGLSSGTILQQTRLSKRRRQRRLFWKIVLSALTMAAAVVGILAAVVAINEYRAGAAPTEYVEVPL